MLISAIFLFNDKQRKTYDNKTVPMTAEILKIKDDPKEYHSSSNSKKVWGSKVAAKNHCYCLLQNN